VLRPLPDGVERRPDGSFLVRWESEAAELGVAVHAGPSPDAIDWSRPLGHTRAREIETPALDPRRRHYFGLLAEGAARPLLVAERRLPLEGARNFRDAGGYPTREGRRVRWGRIYRSDHLAGLSDADRAFLAGLRLGLVCDFRTDAEREKRPSRLGAESGASTVLLSIAPGSPQGFRDAVLGPGATPERVRALMLEVNRALALEHAATYARMFELLLEAPERPALLHCAGGKDRTGFAAALVLLALGVPRETVMEDYLLTARYLTWHGRPPLGRRQREELGLADVDPDLLRPLGEARPEYLAAALAAIDAHHDSLDDYLESRLGLGPARRAALCAQLLE
jgi:protein-tyrosine phosphatase